MRAVGTQGRKAEEDSKLEETGNILRKSEIFVVGALVRIKTTKLTE